MKLTMHDKISDFLPSFAQGAQTYEQVAWVQKAAAKTLVDSLIKQYPVFYPNRILDVGSGTGYVVENLLPFFPNSTYILNDIEPKMLNNAVKKLQHFSNISYQIGDAEKCKFMPNELTISNMAFQWFEDLPITINRLSSNSEILAFSILLDGTFSEWWELCDFYGAQFLRPSYYKYEELAQVCANINPRDLWLLRKEVELDMDSPLAFIRYVKQLGANLSNSVHCPKLLSMLRQERGRLLTKYQLCFVILRK
ncbi:MAG: methyltransferase domain-containing protein [Proteobacteria bacterium]|nr:methyltransferase domain-containing protein [Pseudomonadota bacterium]